jgi:beta-phosphoglucomutase-like phosphatase (HAD superfamily)
VAVEDSTNGLLAARAAGLGVVAVPNRSFPPTAEALEAADVVVGSLHELTPPGGVTSGLLEAHSTVTSPTMPSCS